MALSKLSQDDELHAKDHPFEPFQPNFGEHLGINLFRLVNKVVPWYKLPGFLGAFNLAILRLELRQFNLHDGYASPVAQGNATDTPLPDERYLGARHSDGKFNSLERPLMGCTAMRFGRNFPREFTGKPTEEELMTPNPRMISDRFMARKEGGFIPATTLNLLAAAWIQFQIHDWFNHQQVSPPPLFAPAELTPPKSDAKLEVPIPPEGHPWPHGKMDLHRTKPDDVLDQSDMKCPGYRNENTAWWDGSQIYGSSEAITQSLRSKHPDGKLTLDESGNEAFLPRDAHGNVLTGFNNNWWTGMEMLHTLFAREHNAICDKLREEYPDMSGYEPPFLPPSLPLLSSPSPFPLFPWRKPS